MFKQKFSQKKHECQCVTRNAKFSFFGSTMGNKLTQLYFLYSLVKLFMIQPFYGAWKLIWTKSKILVAVYILADLPKYRRSKP